MRAQRNKRGRWCWVEVERLVVGEAVASRRTLHEMGIPDHYRQSEADSEAARRERRYREAREEREGRGSDDRDEGRSDG